MKIIRENLSHSNVYSSFTSGAGLGGSQPCQESPAHHEPSRHEEAQATAHQETLAVLQEPATASTGSSRKNSLMPGSHHRSLRESFRKLVRPLVKLRGGGGDNEDEANNSTDDEAAAASSWRDFSRRSSRRDSRQSAGAQQQQHTPERSGGGGQPGGLNSINSRLRLDDSLDGNLAEEELSPGGGGVGDDCESVGGGVPAPDSKWRKILGISLAISRY
jgi:hypothetical protein